MIRTTKINQVAKQKAIIKETQVQRGEAMQSFSFRFFSPSSVREMGREKATSALGVRMVAEALKCANPVSYHLHLGNRPKEMIRQTHN